MNYYQDLKNGYYMNNSDERYNDYFNKDKCYYDNDFNKNYYSHNNNRCCRVRKVEETYLCFPSYYTEEQEEKKDRCFEGTFKICPKHYDNGKDDCKNKDYDKDEHKCGYRCHNRCGFCGLFRSW